MPVLLYVRAYEWLLASHGAEQGGAARPFQAIASPRADFLHGGAAVAVALHEVGALGAGRFENQLQQGLDP